MKRILLILAAFFALANPALAVVNINSASQAELESLKGIGPVKAKAIIDYRSQHGPFKGLDDLDKVKGIGKGTLDKIRNEITGPARETCQTRCPCRAGSAGQTHVPRYHQCRKNRWNTCATEKRKCPGW
jgi:competence protein ComEA